MSQPIESAGDIFDAAVELPKAQREAFLAQACGGNAALRLRIEALLRAHEGAGTFMESPALGPLPDAGNLQPRDQSGESIGRYKLLQQIGEGGCGVVYMAEQQEPMRRLVALKIIKLGMDTKAVIARFEAERQALALMDHPNIAKVLDASATETGRPFFVMELVRGIPITRYCDGEQLEARQRLLLFVQVCRAVQHAHQKGIIHRDLKPTNILVADHDGVAVPKIIDFGIAKATSGQRLTNRTLFTAFEQFIGTPAYMSPEQAKMSGLDIDTRSDIYSLGVLLYELLTGKTPFESKRLAQAGLDELRRIIQEEEPTRPSTRLRLMLGDELTTTALQRRTDGPKLIHLVRGDLDWIVMRAMEKDRARRYETANGLALDIERHLNSQPVLARPASAAYRFQRTVHRHKLLFAAVGGVSLALVLGIIGSTLEAVRARRAEDQLSLFLADTQAAQKFAQYAADQAKNSLIRQYFAEANRLIEAHDGPDAIPYLVRILEREPENTAVLTRLATLLTYHAWMVPTATLQHNGWVTSAQFSPDGKRLVTGSREGDNSARIWDAQSGQLLGGPFRCGGYVESVQFSPDGTRVVIASADMTAQIRDVQTDLLLTPPLKHTGTINHARFSPDGRRLVTASDDGTAIVWDTLTGQLVLGPLRHQGEVLDAEFSPDGTRIVTASKDGKAQIWDAGSAQLIAVPLKHSKAVTSAHFSPDGHRVLTASEDGTARLWDATTGHPLTAPLPHSAPLTSAQFSPDGTRVVTASRDNTARLWDANTGKALIDPLRHERAVNCVEFSPDGRRILTASEDHTARVWDTQTGQPLTEPLQHVNGIFAAHFSPNGRRILTCAGDNTARVWDLQAAPPLNEPLRHAGLVRSAQFSPNGQCVLTASDDGTAHVWDALTGQLLTSLLNPSNSLPFAQLSPNGERIATVCNDCTARVWDARTGQALTEPLRHEKTINCIQFSPDARRLVTASEDCTARVWDTQTGHLLLKPLQHPGSVSSARFSPDGTRLVTGCWDRAPATVEFPGAELITGRARVWDARTGQLLLDNLKHNGPVAAAQFSPDGTRIVTASSDRTAQIWDAKTGNRLTPPLNHADYVVSAQFSPDGKLVATASRDGTARVWDAQIGQPIAPPLQHLEPVELAQFSPDSKLIATASTDHTARLWDPLTGQPVSDLFRHTAKVYTALFSPDGRRLVTASDDATARLWDVGLAPSRCTDWLIKLAEAFSGYTLNTHGVLEPSLLDRTQTIARVRKLLDGQPDDADGVRWGRWMLADRATRTISPFSSVTVPQYIERRLKENTPESLREIEDLRTETAP